MAIINYTDQIKYAGRGYLDAKMMPVQTVDDLKNIPATQRFEGLTVVVLNHGAPQDYWLIGGTTNSCWKPKTATTFDDLKLVLEDGFLKLTNAGVQLGDSVDLNSFFPETDKNDLYINSIDYTTKDEQGKTGVFMCFTYSDNTKKYLDMSQFLAATYEAGQGIVIDGNVISLDAAIEGRIEALEDQINELTNAVNDKVSSDSLDEAINGVNDELKLKASSEELKQAVSQINKELANKASITDVEGVEAATTDLAQQLIEEVEARTKGDTANSVKIEAIQTEVASNKTNIDSHAAEINVLKERVAALSSSAEGSTPDGKTIGITDDEQKALYVKVLKKEGNILSVATENAETGLYACVPVFCEDEELNEE